MKMSTGTCRDRNQRGFTLIEMVIVIIVIGIVVAVALRSGTQVVDTARTEQAKRELEALAFGITGNPALQNNGVRTEFGYVGDVGALPANLDALVINPGYATWDGPYVSNEFTQLTNDYKTDPWGNGYGYAGGTTIVSTGSGSSITRRVANSAAELLRNRVSGVFLDVNGTSPGNASDSVVALLRYPNGAGSFRTSVCTSDVGGYFAFDSIPIGSHTLTITYPRWGQIDTLTRPVAVAPGAGVYQEMRSPYDLWMATGLGSGLIGHWKLDETSGSTAADASGYGNHGTLTNMNPALDWTASGHLGGALRFDGTNDKVVVNDAEILDNVLQLTMSVWVYPTRLDGNPRGPLSKRVHWTSDYSYAMFFYGGNLLNVDIDGNNDRFAAPKVYTINQWYHLAVVFDGTLPASQRVKVYVDGVLNHTATESGSAVPNTASPVVIGQLNGNDLGYFQGLIDDVRVYGRALTAAEITQLAGM